MTTWILADTHAGANRDADEALRTCLERAANARTDLLMMGDLFAVWLASDRFLTQLQREILDLFRTVRVRGGRVRFVVGNRDYFARDQLGSAFDEVVDHETVLEVEGIATLVLHGDRINPDDRWYALWYGLSRSAGSASLLRALPTAVAQQLSQRVERALARTNRAYKRGTVPVDRLKDVGRRARSLGAARALCGHFHLGQTIEVEDGVPVVIAPAWLEHRQVLVARADGSLSTAGLADL